MKRILFNDKFGLTRAVIDGRKTMTRRIIKCPREINGESVYIMSADRNPETNEIIGCSALNDEGWILDTFYRKYKIGEVVAVAQPYRDCVNDILVNWGHKTDIAVMAFKELPGWTNRMFVRADLMPHKIRITNVRIERLQDISEEDCLREGIYEEGSGVYVRVSGCDYEYPVFCYDDYDRFATPREAFAALIDKVSGKGTWERNPFVFVYSFELVE